MKLSNQKLPVRDDESSPMDGNRDIFYNVGLLIIFENFTFKPPWNNQAQKPLFYQNSLFM